jgi:hypothetical protein
MTLLDEALSKGYVYCPQIGPWYYDGFPERITVMGMPFMKSRLSERCPRVLAQYREACPYGSMHLKVAYEYDKYGRPILWWSVDHIDLFNPQRSGLGLKNRGRPIGHFLTDHPSGRILKPAIIALAGTLALSVL